MNRYAWTDHGPITILDGGNRPAAHVKRWLLDKHGVTVRKWARNWAEFLGWQEQPLHMDEPA